MNEVRTTGRIPVKSWATQIEDSCWQQAENLSNLPFAQHHIALMPDAHPGYGMPIGGVLFADKAIVPYAVGVDIGCGVQLLNVDRNRVSLDPGDVLSILEGIRRRVPVGNGPQAQHAKTQGPFLDIDRPISAVAEKAIADAEVQLGTLGGGNHFLELQADEAGDLYFMLHSGSRSVGKKICDHWHKIALGLNQRWHSQLPDKELAYLPWGTDEAEGYFNDMEVAMAWAEENRRRMAAAATVAIADVLGGGATFIVDVHHNYATWENHFGRNGIIHRKGAVRARADDIVLIPGSMGTASYVGVGLGNPDSFETCQHGAGRARSRGDTRRMTTVDAMHDQMAAAGVLLLTPNDKDVIDESSIAYKDIEEVMAASADLVKPTKRLVPIGVVKG